MIILLQVEIDELVMKVEPEIYQKYGIMSNKRKSILYVQIKNSLHGIIHSALLVYINLAKELEIYGFHINPYDPCVANKIINDNQMAVLWQVEDLKVSHFNSFEITKFEGYLSIIYGGLTVHGIKVHY